MMALVHCWAWELDGISCERYFVRYVLCLVVVEMGCYESFFGPGFSSVGGFR